MDDIEPNLAGSGLEWAKAQALKGIESRGYRDHQQRKRDEVLTLTDEDKEDRVEVICIVETRPWTHERPLSHGETTVVPRKVAKVMEARKQVVVRELPKASELQPQRRPGRPRKEPVAQETEQ